MSHEERIDRARTKLGLLRREIEKRIVGHDELIEGILACLFAGGHVLLEGVPGLGKTLLVKTMSDALDLQFSTLTSCPAGPSGELGFSSSTLESAFLARLLFPQRQVSSATLIACSEISWWSRLLPAGVCSRLAATKRSRT